jgi:LAO/AO transport system kinase
MQEHFARVKDLARRITKVENESDNYQAILEGLHPSKTPLIGITGAPGAGKSSLVNALISYWLEQGKRIGIVAVDPTSPFNYGALLGDRLRMAAHFNQEQVFIRSVGTRGSLGGLCEKIVEISDVMKDADFDFVLIETVGVGQSEVEIAGLADMTIVVLTPDGGDDIQSMKSGIMEIADLIVVNKADRPHADGYAANLIRHLHEQDREVPVLKTVATENKGVDALGEAMLHHLESGRINQKRNWLLTEKAFRLIQKSRMRDIDRNSLYDDVSRESSQGDFNIYAFAKKY